MSKHRDFVRALRFTLFIGAAFADGSDELRQRLRDELPPLLAQFRKDGKTRPILSRVVEIMGPDWVPSQQWADAIRGIQ